MNHNYHDTPMKEKRDKFLSPAIIRRVPKPRVRSEVACITLVALVSENVVARRGFAHVCERKALEAGIRVDEAPLAFWCRMCDGGAMVEKMARQRRERVTLTS
jgi:hypothetical protein